jgi:hypothetical protein
MARCAVARWPQRRRQKVVRVDPMSVCPDNSGSSVRSGKRFERACPSANDLFCSTESSAAESGVLGHIPRG